MKRIVLTVIAAFFAACIVNAQDLATATETYNSGAEQLSMGNKEAALTAFQEALALGEACGEEGADLVANCKSTIPSLILSIGKELYNDKNFDEALAKVKEASEKAAEYGNEEVVEEVADLIPVITGAKTMAEGTEAFNAKDYAKAVESFKAVLESDPENGAAALRIVQCLSNLGDFAAAKEALAVADANGQGANAKKVLGGALLKKAAADLKAGKSAEAVEAAVESAEYAENAQAYLIAGQASTKANKSAQAIEYYEKYLELSPNAKNAGAITFTVAALYQQAGNKAKAIENYKKVLADPTYGTQAKTLVESLSK